MISIGFYIESLLAKNVTCFPKVQLSFSPGINIIVGANNTGKSTLLRLLASAVRPQELMPSRRNAQETTTTTLYIKGRPDNSTNKFEIPGIGYINQQDRVLIQPDKKTSLIWSLESQNGGLNSLAREVFQQWFYVLDDRRNQFTEFDYTVSGQAVSNRAVGFKNLPALIDFHMSSSDGRREKFLDWCKEVIPVYFQQNYVDNGKSLGYFPEETFVDLKQMGSGVTQVIGIIASSLYPQSQIILIDELESDLHPKAVRALCRLILQQSSAHQYFITTHSSVVLSELSADLESRLYSVRAVEGKRDSSGAHIQSFSEASEVEREMRREILCDLGYVASDLGIYDYWIVLEESTLQSIIDSVFLQKEFKKLQGRVKVISSGGAGNVSHRTESLIGHILYGHLQKDGLTHIRVIIDGGKVGEEVANNLCKKFKSLESNITVLSEDRIEKFYPDFETLCYEIGIDPDRLDKLSTDEKVKLMRKVIDKCAADESFRDLLMSSFGQIVTVLQDIREEMELRGA